MSHKLHEVHSHNHSENCGHQKIKHDDHIDYIHGDHLHHKHENHWDECKIEDTNQNPSKCKKIESTELHNDDCGHQKIPHGDHYDFLVDGRLENVHDNHIDDHGPVDILWVYNKYIELLEIR